MLMKRSDMVTGHDIANLAMSQEGDAYVWGAEASASDTNPAAFDCSEIVQWVCGRLAVTPIMPDGSWLQARHCDQYGTLVSVDEAIRTEGALLFRFSESPFRYGRPIRSHVAISRGDGTTIEARGRLYGVGSWTAFYRGWTHAALIPGVIYQTRRTSMFILNTADAPAGLRYNPDDLASRWTVEYWQRQFLRVDPDLIFVWGVWDDTFSDAIRRYAAPATGAGIGPGEADRIAAAVRSRTVTIPAQSFDIPIPLPQSVKVSIPAVEIDLG